MTMRKIAKVGAPMEYGVAGSSVQRILCAAEELFAQRGFAAVSISGVAARAGVSKASVFYHFSSKRELYFAVLEAASRQFGRIIEALGKGEGPVCERLRHYAEAHLGCILQNEQVSRLVLSDLLENQPQLSRDLAEKIFGNNFARLVGIIRASQNNDELRQDIDPAMVAVLLIGADVFFFEAREVLRHFADVRFAETPQRYSGMLADVLLRGILPLPDGGGRNAKNRKDGETL